MGGKRMLVASTRKRTLDQGVTQLRLETFFEGTLMGVSKVEPWRLSLAVLTIAFTMLAVDSSHGNAQAPESPVQFVRSIFLMGSSGELSLDSFFSDENLKRKFHADSVTHVDIKAGRRYYLIGVPPFPDQVNVPIRAQIAVNFFRATSGEVTISMNFVGGVPSASSENVTRALGPDWREDVETENAIFLATVREAFNPPARPTRIITYECTNVRTVDCRLSLDFGSSDQLRNLTLTTTVAGTERRERSTEGR